MKSPQTVEGISLSTTLRMLLFVSSVLVVFPLMLEPVGALASRSLLSSQAAWTAALNWGVFLAVAIPTAIAARLERRPFGAYGYPRRRAGGRLTEGVAWGVAMASLAAGVLQMTGAADFESAALPVATATVSGVLWWLARLGFAALDQLMWRGYLQVTAARALGFWPAAWMLAIAFTVEKLLGIQYRHVLPLAAFLAWGLLCALMLRRTGSLWFGTGLQLGLDWGLVFLYGLGVPGTSSLHPPGALMNASAHDAFVTGGDAGVRGSVIMPALVGLAALLVHVRFVRLTRGDAAAREAASATPR